MISGVNITTVGGNITFDGAASTDTAAVTVSSGLAAGTVDFNSTLTLGAGGLQVTSLSAFFDAAINDDGVGGTTSPLTVSVGDDATLTGVIGGVSPLTSLNVTGIDLSVGSIGTSAPLSAGVSTTTSIVATTAGADIGSLVFTGTAYITGGATVYQLNDSASAGENLTVPGTANMQTTSGALRLRAGDDLTLTAGAVVRSADVLQIDGDFGNADAAGTTISIEGTTGSVTAVGGAAISGNSNDDVVRVRGERLGASAYTVNLAAGADFMTLGLGNGVTLNVTSLRVNGGTDGQLDQFRVEGLSDDTSFVRAYTVEYTTLDGVTDSSGRVALVTAARGRFNSGPAPVIGTKIEAKEVDRYQFDSTGQGLLAIYTRPTVSPTTNRVDFVSDQRFVMQNRVNCLEVVGRTTNTVPANLANFVDATSALTGTLASLTPTNYRGGVIMGGAGKDTLIGTGFSDVLYGDGGIDELRGRDGNDILLPDHKLVGGVPTQVAAGGDASFGEGGIDDAVAITPPPSPPNPQDTVDAEGNLSISGATKLSVVAWLRARFLKNAGTILTAATNQACSQLLSFNSILGVPFAPAASAEGGDVAGAELPP
ncbi:MAG TPA: hypothetical protein PLV92_19655, partial [Pirellulaceae bacterium]|nr:hypothetical protein [Pirellulaceae bacterium]